MEYYLTRMTFLYQTTGSLLPTQSTITQLVWASNEDNARKAVKDSAIKDGVKEEYIFEIRVDDTLIGE